MNVLGLMLALYSSGANLRFGLPTQAHIVLADKSFEAKLADGGKVKIVEVSVQEDGYVKVLWPADRRGKGPMDGTTDKIEDKEDERVVWITYQVPVGRTTPMRTWIHDPDVEGTSIKKSGKAGMFTEPLYFPKSFLKADLRLGVPYGAVHFYRTFKIKSVKGGTDSAWFGDTLKPGRTIISVDLPLDPSSVLISASAKTKKGQLIGGALASWNMDEYGRMIRFPPQDFAFEGVDRRALSGLVVNTQSIAYVEFRGVPLAP